MYLEEIVSKISVPLGVLKSPDMTRLGYFSNTAKSCLSSCLCRALG